MNKLWTSITATTAGIFLLAGLTGCSGNPDDSNEPDFGSEDYAAEFEMNEQTIYTTTFNAKEEVVQITSSDKKEPLYTSESFETLDTSVLRTQESQHYPMTDWRSASPSVRDAASTSKEVVTTIEIDGKEYPVAARVSREVYFDNLEEGVVYYNTYVAPSIAAKKAAATTPQPPTPIISDMIGGYFNEVPWPEFTYVTNGQTLITVNSAVAADKANGLSAAEAWSNLHKGASDEYTSLVDDKLYAYAYSYSCASYGVQHADSVVAALQADNAMLGADVITGAYALTKTIYVETAEPCDVIRFKPDGDQTPSYTDTEQDYSN